MIGWVSIWMLLGLVLVIAAVAAGFYVAVRLSRSDNEPRLEEARELLDRRLATGEISPEEYFERESALRTK